jgi:hypothetical protein
MIGNMKLNDLIFSEKLIFRLRRHFLFWSSVFALYFLVEASVYLSDGADSVSVLDITSDLNLRHFSTRLINTVEGVIFLMAYSYIVVYFLMPRYLMRKRYFMFGSLMIVLTIVIEIIRLLYLGVTPQMPKDEIIFIVWMTGLSFVNIGPPIICGLFITIKMLKTWYVKEEEKLKLIQENANAELQLLKAQIHPHFLFNTLNNIYSFALNKSPQAPELVLRLSDAIEYMINECDASLVLVEKEIKMIDDYIGLEKVRYGNQLDLQVQIIGDYNNKLIAPFLLIPFLENSFKHGASQILSSPWIKLTLSVNDHNLYFELSNSKPNLTPTPNEKKGVGLSNVEKRLQLLYPKSHELTIINQVTCFNVIMKVPLQNGIGVLSSTNQLH